PRGVELCECRCIFPELVERLQWLPCDDGAAVVQLQANDLKHEAVPSLPPSLKGPGSRRQAPPGHLTFGLRSSCERAELMLALVTRVTPVSTLADTFSPFEAASAVLTPS